MWRHKCRVLRIAGHCWTLTLTNDERTVALMKYTSLFYPVYKIQPVLEPVVKPVI